MLEQQPLLATLSCLDMSGLIGAVHAHVFLSNVRLLNVQTRTHVLQMRPRQARATNENIRAEGLHALKENAPVLRVRFFCVLFAVDESVMCRLGTHSTVCASFREVEGRGSRGEKGGGVLLCLRDVSPK